MRVLLTLASMLAPMSSAAADCIRVSQLLSPAEFARYPANLEQGPWRAPDIRLPDAHMYRTILRSAGQEAPDFAGRYKIVKIGCGAATICPVSVDRRTGRVVFAKEFQSVSWLLSNFDDALAVGQLAYRRDSRLLAVVGWRNEDERTGGVTLYDWRDGKPHFLRFVPVGQLCRKDAK